MIEPLKAQTYIRRRCGREKSKYGDALAVDAEDIDDAGSDIEDDDDLDDQSGGAQDAKRSGDSSDNEYVERQYSNRR